MDLAGKRIILGVTGSIAAYKAVYLLRLLVRDGANVQVVMTPAAREFVGPVTFSALSGKPALSDFFNEQEGDWNSHVEMGMNADLMLIAPVTATTMGKMAHGIADNLLVSTYLSARCPVVVAPAMDLEMYKHPSTVKNLEILSGWGVHVIEPDTGELASGLGGKGRMKEPEEIMGILRHMDTAGSKKKLLNKRILVTAGPTHENIDPVRFIGNHSSGKMGYAIAEAFAKEGALVYLVSGPVTVTTNHPRVEVVDVTSAEEMYLACERVIHRVDIAIFNAAVSDFTPVDPSLDKVKRGSGDWRLQLKPTKDIAAEMGKKKKKGQFFVGFALETDEGIESARKKLSDKNLDLIVLNTLQDQGSGFGTDTNRVTLLNGSGKPEKLRLKAKSEVASDLVNKVIKLADYA